jgi:hypothetical protein
LSIFSLVQVASLLATLGIAFYLWRWQRAWPFQPLAVSVVGLAAIEGATFLPYTDTGGVGLTLVGAIAALGSAGIAAGILSSADRYSLGHPSARLGRLLGRPRLRRWMALLRALWVPTLAVAGGLFSVWTGGQPNPPPLQIAGVLTGAALVLLERLFNWDRVHNRGDPYSTVGDA